MYQPQSNFGFSSQQQFGQQAGAQYRGMQQRFQPTGYVQSAYNPNASFAQSNAQNPQAASYHTASYRGNQPGHDQYLRADSTQPNAAGAFAPQASQSAFAQPQASQAFGQSTAFGTANASAYQQAAPQAYHTASYRGNQPGHDQYLRADSTQPNAAGAFAPQASQSAFAQPQASQAFGQSTAFGAANTSAYQQAAPQAYHTASYRGNQQGHDQYLRADSVQPAQNQAQFFGR